MISRWVDPVNVYERRDGNLVRVAVGVTHYRAPWRDEIVGERLYQELVAAGLPPWARVTYFPDTNEVDVVVPGDDTGAHADLIERTLDDHQGSKAADHRALMEFHTGVQGVAERMAAGTPVSAAERDIAIGVLLRGRR